MLFQAAMVLRQFAWIFMKKFSKLDTKGEVKYQSANGYLTDYPGGNFGDKSRVGHFTGIGFFIFGKIFHEFAKLV